MLHASSFWIFKELTLEIFDINPFCLQSAHDKFKKIGMSSCLTTAITSCKTIYQSDGLPLILFIKLYVLSFVMNYWAACLKKRLNIPAFAEAEATFLMQ